jgi:hypothetical protein
MNATRIQINGRNAIALVLAVVMVALTAALVLATPELVVARPYAASSEIAAETSLLAENPELMMSRRYAASSETAAEAALLSENPELMMSRRYAASSEIAAEAALLSANPELMVARRYVPPGGWTRRMPQHLKLQNKVDPDTDIGLLEFFKPQTKEVSTPDQLSSVLASNPELSVARRYAASGVIAAEAALLSANPELMVSRRYVPPGGWTRRMPQYVPLHNKVDPDRDIGLLEFSKLQTIKEVSTPDQLSSVLASNPELSVARRYAARGIIAAEAAFLAANPELMVARRYATLPEGRAHQHLDDY